MTYAKTALTLLRLGIGLYLIFIAATRLIGYQPTGSFQAIYTYLSGGAAVDGAVVNGTAIAIGASVFLAVLGLILLSGRLLVIGGILVALVGIVSGIGEFMAAQTPGLLGSDAFTLISNGVRDILVLASTGVAIASLDSYVRHRRYADRRALRASGVSMYREEVPIGTTGSPGRTVVTEHDDYPRRPLQ